jgi:hypothetical protein
MSRASARARRRSFTRSMHNCRIETPARDRRQNCTHITHN